MSSSSTRNIKGMVKEYGQPPSKKCEATTSTVGSGLARQSLFTTINEDDKGHIVRSSTFHEGISQASNYSSNSVLSRPHYSNFSSSSSQNSSATGSKKSNEAVDAEKKRRKRRQNTESARRVRERKRTEMERMEHLYTENEGRIRELEVMAEDLSKELRRNQRFSDSRSQMYNFEKDEDRPKWFGAPF